MEKEILIGIIIGLVIYTLSKISKSSRFSRIQKNILYFWKGAISIDWLEKQTPAKILSIVKNQNRIIKEENKNVF